MADVTLFTRLFSQALEMTSFKFVHFDRKNGFNFLAN